jgi:hypothetical protein
VTDPIHIVHTESLELNGTVILSKKEVWLTFAASWWQLSMWFWWWLYPGKKAWMHIMPKGQTDRVRVRVVRIAETYYSKG